MNIKMVCLEALEKIINTEAYSEEVIKEYLQKFEMTKEGRALFIDIVTGVMINLFTLEYYLTPYIEKKRYKPWMKPLLYISIYQIYYLDFDEDEVIQESYEIAKIKDRFSSSLIRIILNKVVNNPIRPIDELDELNRLSIKYSYPVWLVTYLLKDYQIDTVEKILKVKYNNNQLVRINNKITNRLEILDILEKENIVFKELDNGSDTFLLENIDNNHYLFKEMKIIKESVKSWNIASKINCDEEIEVLDLFARISNCGNYLSFCCDKAHISACEFEESNLRKLKNKSLKLKSKIDFYQVNPLSIDKMFLETTFDYIIANVPSSGFGLLSQKIDLKYHLNMNSLASIIKYQDEIIQKASNLVKAGGYFIYITDSIISDENHKQIAKLVNKNKDYKIIFEKTILPSKTTGGYYICQLRRS